MNKPVYAFIPKVGEFKSKLDYYKGDPVFVEMTELTESIIQKKTEEWGIEYDPESSISFGAYRTTAFKKGDIINLKNRIPQDWKIYAFSVGNDDGSLSVHLKLVADPSQTLIAKPNDLILVR